MMCRHPFRVAEGVHVSCGQCLNCRINRERIWVFRLILEQSTHERSSFVTLTYNDENIPKGATLVPADLQKFIKRLRRRRPVKSVRYYAVGEYGNYGRPHYHLALFGVGGDEIKEKLYKTPDTGRSKLIRYIPDLDKSWDLGYIDVGDLNKYSSRYLVGYVTKGLTRSKKAWLNGRHPEFSRMSNRPGIGADAARLIGTKLAENPLYPKEKGSVCKLQVGRSQKPIGDYLRRIVAEHLGLDKKDMEDEWERWHQSICAEALVSGKSSVREYLLDIDESNSYAQRRKREYFKQRRGL